MNILGINAYHGDASAALLVDGRLAVAVEEERFNRIKHWAGFPAESIRYCLGFAGLTIRDVDHVAISFDPRANLHRRIGFVLAQRPSLSAVWNRLKRQRRVTSLRSQLAEACDCCEVDIRAPVHRVEHHLAHVASGFHVSPFEEAAILSVDGMGDFVSTLTARGRGTGCGVFRRIYYPHSLGFLYNAITLYLGFPAYGDEYKVMGLAPYGKPEYLELFRRIVFPKGDGFELNMDYFTHHKRGITMTWNDGAPVVQPFHSGRLERELGPPREPRADVTEKHQNIAASLQAVTEEIIFHLLGRLHERARCDNLCIVGGVAMNSVANGKVTLRTPFKSVYVPGGAADNGTSFGAAFHVWHRVLGKPRGFVLDHAYWGCEVTDAECLDAIRAEGVQHESMGDDALMDRVVAALCEGRVIGWFCGRMEFGARALGSRSLLADPRREDMRDIINLKIKFREKFRPFAPSILEERVAEYFEVDAPSPFMEKVFQVRPEKRAVIPAVTHVDGSGRLQTVSRRTNPRYWALIKRFEDRTGVPIVLNTSLNENEPIVRTPNEAIRCFLRTQMDALVLGRHFVTRKG
ncbi:MAG TPA: carbamoyltransferase C-terminal domain-containing protein [Verrucomicrobiae bacterium]|nr:carbamoyltransferase C-terminal domain-containing protein [Verrucomicrobiae bacterium]